MHKCDLDNHTAFRNRLINTQNITFHEKVDRPACKAAEGAYIAIPM